jgi:hypothetical protein
MLSVDFWYDSGPAPSFLRAGREGMDKKSAGGMTSGAFLLSGALRPGFLRLFPLHMKNRGVKDQGVDLVVPFDPEVQGLFIDFKVFGNHIHNIALKVGKGGVVDFQVVVDQRELKPFFGRVTGFFLTPEPF